jgi:SnoaL-like domain
MHHTFRSAIEARDFDAVGRFFADDVVMRSPIARRPYCGREAVVGVLSVVSTVFEDFAYEREIRSDSGGDHVLIFNARVDGLAIQGCDVLQYRKDGLIDQLTVMLRPLKAVLAFEARVRIEFERAMAKLQRTAGPMDSTVTLTVPLGVAGHHLPWPDRRP